MIETDAWHQPFEVDDLDRVGVLDMFEDAETLDRQAQRRKLRLALRWAELNPAGPEDAATYGDGMRGSMAECEVPIAGQGAPLVAASAVPLLGARMGTSLAGAQSWLADGLDLAHRLRLIHARVEALEVPVWKARRVAVLTRNLSQTAAAWVDAQLAGRLHQVGFVTIGRVIDAAVAIFHPDRIDTDPEAAKSAWHVTLGHPLSGAKDNSFLDVTADTVDLVALHDLVCAVAEALRLSGDGDTLDQRKAKALGLIGRDEHHDLLAAAKAAGQPGSNDPDGSEPDSSGSDTAETTGTGGLRVAGSDAAEAHQPASPRWKPRRPGTPTKIYLHLNAADLTDDLAGEATDGQASDGSGRARIGHLEGIGAVTLARIREWAGRPGVRIQPVIHTGATGASGAVDCHDPPEWMAELVRLRDPHCVFPGCHRPSRSCDLDHIKTYRPHGPPGQTHPAGLAPLCRRHHNAKTHHGWRYHRLPNGTYLWTDPYGGTYLVTPTTNTIINKAG